VLPYDPSFASGPLIVRIDVHAAPFAVITDCSLEFGRTHDSPALRTARRNEGVWCTGRHAAADAVAGPQSANFGDRPLGSGKSAGAHRSARWSGCQPTSW